MDRATRKANLRKLQLPGTSAKTQHQRKTRQCTANTIEAGLISSHFISAESPLRGRVDETDSLANYKKGSEIITEPEAKPTPPNPKPNRAKRTKLDAFVFKSPPTIAAECRTVSKPNQEEVFDTPEEKTKKAPSKQASNKIDKASGKRKNSKRGKKQTTIKSAFLRNEQLFAEIAAQHCAVDNFNGDDIQLAIAISKSEAESKGIDIELESEDVQCIVEPANDEQKAENIRQKLEKYGFRTAEQKDYSTFAAAFMPQAKARRPKCKWANKFTALTLRDEQLQSKKLHHKIETLLNQQFRTRHLMKGEEEFAHFILQSPLLRKYENDFKSKVIKLSENAQTSNENYFVAELFQVSELPVGYLLKDWTAIQGRDLTPKKGERKNDKESKLQKIYEELEEYFKSLKNVSCLNEHVAEDIENSSRRKSEDSNDKGSISNKIPKADESAKCSNYFFMKHKTEDNTVMCDKQSKGDYKDQSVSSSDTTCLSTSVVKLLPTTKDLDLMQVSSSSLNTQEATAIITKEVQLRDGDVPNFSCSSQKENAVKKCISAKNSLDFGLDYMQVSGSFKTTKDNKEITHCHTQRKTTNLQEKPSVSADESVFVALPSNSLGDETFSKSELKIGSPEPINKKNIPLPLPEPAKHNELEIKSVRKDTTNVFDDMLVSRSSNVQVTLANSQRNRSNSPDLFADSDVEMEDDGDGDKVNISDGTLRTKISNSVEELVTYEIYSSDEVKNSSSLDKPNKSSTFTNEEVDIIDLTQDDERKTDGMHLNLSRSIVEEDLFADSPLTDELEEVKDINCNSQDKKYLKSKRDETFKLTLSPFCEARNKSPIKVANNKAVNKTFSEKQIHEQEFLDDVDEGDDDDDVIVLHDMKVNQTNSSFLNFKASQQLTTSFHRHTANGNKTVISDTKNNPSKPGDDTIFRDLYHKYLGDSAKSNQKVYKSVDESSLSLPINTPKPLEYGTQFTMDCSVTDVDHSSSMNRKSLSFAFKTPEKARELENVKLSKSQSLEELNFSIDLTKNKDDNDITTLVNDDDDDDEDCLMLSDDEINYSIWKSNKTARLDDIEDEGSFITHHGRTINTSVLDILKQDMSPPRSFMSPQPETSKYKKLTQLEESNTPLERSHFGILEEFSEPIEFTSNMCTPTKIADCNDSFLNLSCHAVTPMNGFKSIRKSINFLNLLDNSPPINNNMEEDYDEFDFPVDNRQSTVPQGLEQLLTAEISFEESDVVKKTFSSSIYCNNLTDKDKPTPNAKHISTSSHLTVAERQEFIVNNKTYTIRQTQSPKPDYTLYSEAELLKALYNYGIKPLKRKQAVKILEYIYVQTHPLLVSEDDTSDISNDDNRISTLKSPDGNISLSPTAFAGPTQNLVTNKTTAVAPCNGGVSKKLNLRDASGMDMLRYCLDLKAELPHEHYILQTNVTKKTPQPLLPLHIAWFNLVCSNPHLHESVLMYDPIDLQDIYIFLKGLGYRYDPKDLKQFFDNRCIIFRYDLAAAGSGINKHVKPNRHVRKIKNVKR